MSYKTRAARRAQRKAQKRAKGPIAEHKAASRQEYYATKAAAAELRRLRSNRAAYSNVQPDARRTKRRRLAR